MTRILNFIFLFLLAGIFYVQTDGFGANINSAQNQQATLEAQPAAMLAVKKASFKPEPAKPAALLTKNALSGVEKHAITARFAAQRLAASTVIRTTVMTKEPAPSNETKASQFTVSGNLVNARAEPSTSSKVLTKLRQGTVVAATGQSKGAWVKVVVQDTGQSVWMHSNFLAAESQT
jgi:uncharacterized protein YgiM (DUF1202 family)